MLIFSFGSSLLISNCVGLGCSLIDCFSKISEYIWFLFDSVSFGDKIKDIGNKNEIKIEPYHKIWSLYLVHQNTNINKCQLASKLFNSLDTDHDGKLMKMI